MQREFSKVIISTAFVLMKWIFNKKLLLTLLLLLFTRHFLRVSLLNHYLPVKDLLNKSTSSLWWHSLERHFKFVLLSLGRALFIWRSLFYTDNIITIYYLFWYQYFTYMEILRVVLWAEGVFNFFCWSMPVSLAQYRGEIGLLYNRFFAPDLWHVFNY